MQKQVFLFLFLQIALRMGAQSEPTDRGSVRMNCDFRVTELMEQYRRANLGKQIPGYRIQLFSGDKTSAFNAKSSFMKQFPQIACNVIYEAPDFKTMAGNFRTTLEAEAAMQDIWPVFKAAFVVPAKIDLPELPPLAEKIE